MKITLSEGQHVQIGSTLVSICRARNGRTMLSIETEDIVRRDKIIERCLNDLGWHRIDHDMWQRADLTLNTYEALLCEPLT